MGKSVAPPLVGPGAWQGPFPFFPAMAREREEGGKGGKMGSMGRARGILVGKAFKKDLKCKMA